MNSRTFSRPDFFGSTAVLLYLAAAKLLIHFLTNSNYGYFRDELYYIACGEHLAWGYVDQAPLIALLVKTARVLFGDSLFALRLLPALAGAALVFLTGIIARDLGGNRLAQILAATCVIIAPAYLAFHTLMTMNAFEPLVWTFCLWVVIRIIKNGDARLWLLFGAAAGTGLMNKHSTVFFGASFVIALLFTPHRKFLFDKWLWLGGALALLIFLPNILWQIAHGFPTIEVLRNADVNQNLPFSPVEFLAGQLLLMHPLTLPVWAAGLYFFLRAEAGRPYRVAGWTFVVLFVVFVLLRAKVYYLAPAFPALFAGGAVSVENLFARLNQSWLKPATVSLMLVGGAVIAPLVLPVLPVETFIKYAGAMGMGNRKVEQRELGELPQHFADMHGWEERVARVAQVFHSLPPEDRARAAIFASNYGQAGAIDFFGERYSLPKAISGHQNYFLWGARDYAGEVVILMDDDYENLMKQFESVEAAATFTHPYVMPDENSATIYVCRRMKVPLADYWAQVKCYSC